MNQINWTKADVMYIHTTLKTQERMFYKGIVFLKIPTKGPIDYLMDYIRPACMQSMGAISQGLSRSIVYSSNQINPCPSCQLVLDSSEASDEIVFTISILDVMYLEPDETFLQFVLAHETAHVLNGDLLPINSVTANSKEYVEREMRADGFAASLFGKDVVAKHLRTILTGLEHTPTAARMVENGLGTSEQIAVTIVQLQTRHEYVSNL